MTFKSDLVDPINDGEYDVCMLCPNQCGANYSANKNDYYTVGDDYLFTCDECKEPLILVKKVVTYEEI
tara:strand:+ start:100 stop:303 length:204 start_codon:yes stop_codon:yes gene_type:complete